MLLALIVFWSLVGALVGALVGVIAQSKGGGFGICGFVIFPIASGGEHAPRPDAPPPRPGFLEAQRAMLAPERPSAEALIHEVSFEGYPCADRSSGSALDMKC